MNLKGKNQSIDHMCTTLMKRSTVLFGEIYYNQLKLLSRDIKYNSRQTKCINLRKTFESLSESLGILSRRTLVINNKGGHCSSAAYLLFLSLSCVNLLGLCVVFDIWSQEDIRNQNVKRKT